MVSTTKNDNKMDKKLYMQPEIEVVKPFEPLCQFGVNTSKEMNPEDTCGDDEDIWDDPEEAGFVDMWASR